MKRWFRIGCYILVAIWLGSCSQTDTSDCFKSTGPRQIQHRDLATYDAIVLEDNVNLWLTYGPGNTVRVEAGKNLIDKVTTEVSGKTLKIANNNSCNWVRRYDVPVDVYIETDRVSFIRHTGHGNVLFENQWQTAYLEYKHFGAGNLRMNIKAHKLNFDHNGLGKAELAGSADHAFFAVQYLGPLGARELLVNNCEVQNNGEADAVVFCAEQLRARVSSVGSIYYYGNPAQVSKQIEGSGKIIAR